MSYFFFVSLFFTIAGFIVGLGAVTVIDIHGFLGRTSSYWTQTTIRAHKITKPLIWLGTIVVCVGSTALYWNDGFTRMHIIQSCIAVMLIFNGCFLSFWLSPRLLERERETRDTELLPKAWQRAITVSFLFSFFGWWSEVALFCWYIVYSV